MDAGVGANRNTTWSFTSVPSVPQQDQETAYHKSRNACHNPRELITGLEGSVVERKTDYNDYDEEAGNLMSSVFARDFLQDGFTDRGLSISHHRSPETYSGDLLHVYQSETEVKQKESVSSNYQSHDALNNIPEGSVDRFVEEFFKRSNGLAVNHQWFSKLPHGDDDGHSSLSPKLKPGLPVFKDGNSYLSQVLQSKNDRSSGLKDEAKPANDILGRPKSSFNPYYQDTSFQSNVKPGGDKQHTQQSFNQHFSHFQSLGGGEYDALPNTRMQTFGLHPESSVGEEWRSDTGVSTQSSPVLLSQKFEMMMDTGKKGGTGNQEFNLNAFCQQLQPFSSLVNLSNSYRNEMNVHRESGKVKQDVTECIQNQVKPQRKKSAEENLMVHMPVILGNGLVARPLNNTYANTEAKAQGFSHSPHFDLQGGLQSPRFNGKNGMIGPGNPQQCVPHMHPVSDFRGYPRNPAISGSRSMLHYRNGVPNIHDKATQNDAAVLNPTFQMRTNREESAYHEESLLMTLNKCGPETQLCSCIDESFMQWQCLEKERKKAEFILTKTFVGKRITAAPNATMPKTPPNPTRVDHLLVKHLREQLKVANVLNWMECLRNSQLPASINTALNKHRMVIGWTNARREEILGAFKQQQHKAQILEGRDILMVMALKDLAVTTRKLRTVLWCALQMTLPKPEKGLEVSDNGEAAGETCASAIAQYIF